jgi:UDP-glucose 4-epimerase
VEYLVFGGAGFIGANLVSELKKHNHEILVFDNLGMGNQIERAGLDTEVVIGDMTDLDAIVGVLRRFGPDRVYHLAANSDIAASAINPKTDLRNTLLTTVQLATALRQVRVNELVFASSSAVYGEVQGKITELSGTKPTSAYGWMKLASEEVLSQLVQDGQLDRYLCVRFPNVTGKWQTHGVIKDLVKKLRADSGNLDVLGDGSQTKPYALAEDLVSNIEKVMNANWQGLLDLNLSPDSQTSVREIVDMLTSVTKLEPTVAYGHSRSGWLGDVPEYSYDTSKAEALLGVLDFRTSLAAVEASIEWEWNIGSKL